jgi:hypothetical protein
MFLGMSFGGSYGAYVARCKRGGYAGGPKRAAFWRALGFPNLVRARTAKARYRLERLKQEEWALARSVNPYALPEDAALWASVARNQSFPARLRTAQEGSLVEQIRRARTAAAHATQPARTDLRRFQVI